MEQSITLPVRLPYSQVEHGASLLANVFQKDPMMRFLVADSTRMLDRPLPFYRANIRMGFLYGEVHMLPSLDGIAIWVKPGKTDFTFGQFLRSGLLTATFSMGLTSLKRLMGSATFFEEMKKRAISRPHWLLLFLGVDPEQQGRGLGGKLIQPMLDRADGEGVPCFLDSTNQRNLTFYQRHGFRIAAQGKVPNGGPETWAMVRDPGSAKAGP